MSESRRIIAVFGGTGLQGSSVVNAVLADKTFTPRVITRNPESDAAQKLRARGVETVRADLSDVKSLEDALRGCECVFGVTHLQLGGDDEFHQGKNIADACKHVGVNLFVWSSHLSIAAASGGKYTRATHFENKARVHEYLSKSDIPHAILRTGFFLENLNKHGNLQKTATPDKLEFHAPIMPGSALFPFTWVERDIGPSVVALCKHYRERDILGQTFYAAHVRCTFDELCSTLSRALGKEVQFVTDASSGSVDIDDSFHFTNEFGFYPEQQIPDPALVALGAEFDAPVADFALDLKADGF